MKKTLIALACLFSLNSSIAQWSQIGGDINGELQSGALGCSISLNMDASILAVGTPNYSGLHEQSGQVKVYTIENGLWTQLGNPINGESKFDRSGGSVKLSSEGNIIAIGAERNDGNGANSGHVRIYRYEEGMWNQIGSDIDGESAEDRSGGSISLSSNGNTVAIGSLRSNGGEVNSGHVRIFKNNNDKWIQVGSDIEGNNKQEYFGACVSLSSDGQIVAIGAPYAHSNGYYSGYVQLYKNENGSWVKLASKINGVAERILSGKSVSINSNGSVVAIGSPCSNEKGYKTGSVRVYKKENGIWYQIGSPIIGEKANTLMGTSVRLNHQGNILLIGAVGASVNKVRTGSAKVFKFETDQWVQIGDDIIGSGEYDRLGCSVSLSKIGNTIAVCAPGNDENGLDAGQVRVFNNKKNIASVIENKDSILNLLEGEWLLKSKQCGLGNGNIEISYPDKRFYKFRKLAHTNDSINYEYYENNVLSKTGTSKLYYTAGWFIEAIEGNISLINDNSTLMITDNLYPDGCNESYQRIEIVSSSPINKVEEVLFYPNPTKGKVYLKKSVTYAVFSIIGTELQSGYGNSIDLSGQLTGIYIIKTSLGIVRVLKL